jgi:hypothetical protein
MSGAQIQLKVNTQSGTQNGRWVVVAMRMVKRTTRSVAIGR